MKLEYNTDYQTQTRGTNDQEYEIYLSAGDPITGLWLDDTPIKSYDEWLNSWTVQFMMNMTSSGL